MVKSDLEYEGVVANEGEFENIINSDDHTEYNQTLFHLDEIKVESEFDERDHGREEGDSRTGRNVFGINI
jgi:hypothetical protein